MIRYKPLITVVRKSVPLGILWNFPKDYQQRKDYTRTKQWTKRQQQAFIDSVLRQSYSPPIVIRELNTPPSEFSPNKHTFEVIDGWQRVQALNNFRNCKFQLPQSLKDCSLFADRVPIVVLGTIDTAFGYYMDLPIELCDFCRESIKLEVDIIKRIDDPNNPKHEQLATKVFQHLHQENNTK
jgi:hypothetical protein